MLNYSDFINEYHDQHDDDGVGFRNHMLSIFMPMAKEDKKKEERINAIVTTFCVASNKELRFDEDLIRELGDLVGMNYEKIMKKLEDETDGYYGGFRGNLVSMT